MKWLFFLLLLVNLGMLAWGIQQDKFFPEKKAVQAPEVGNLRLLSEMQSADTTPAKPPTAEEPTETTPPEAPRLTETESSGGDGAREKGITSAVALQQSDSAKEGGEGTPSDPWVRDAEQSVSESLIEDKRESPEEAGQMVAAEETPEPAVLAEPVEPEAVEEVPEPVVESCGVVGPVGDSVVAGRVLKALQQDGMQATLRNETMQKEVGFWVIIPPYESRRKAIAEVNRLNEEGIMDVRRFYRGKLKNGISLGMFSRKRNAEKRRREIADKGFSPNVLPRTRKVEVFFIDYRVRGEDGERGLQKLIADYPDLEHEARNCPEKLSQ